MSHNGLHFFSLPPPAPYVDGCRQNTLEKTIEHLQKDEAILQEMLEMSTHIHQPHQVGQCLRVVVSWTLWYNAILTLVLGILSWNKCSLASKSYFRIADLMNF